MIQDQNQLVENQNMYIVQKILKRRMIIKGNATRIQYYVKWQNYDSDDNTWEPAENLATVPRMIEKFQKKLAEKKQAQNNKQTNKNKLWSNDSEQNITQIEDRCQRQNGYKLRKKQSGGSKNPSQLFQQIKQTIPDISNTPQILKQPIQIHRKHRNIDSNSGLGFKSKNYKEIDDKQDLRIQKEIKTTKEKQLKMNLQKDNNDKKQKSIPKREEAYGKIVSHIYRDGQLFFEVQKLSNTQKIIRIQQMSKEEVERSCVKGAYQYFYKLLVSLQEART